MALEIRFTVEADEDLQNLSDFGFERFGPVQTARYRKGLLDALMLLSEFPMLGADVSDLRPGLRRHVHDSHAVYYRVRSEGLVISRILGPGQDPTSEFNS